MSHTPNWFQQNPNWVLYAFLPVVGGLAIAYAGWKSKTRKWMGIGCGLAIAGLILHSSSLLFVVWLLQIATAFTLKQPYLIKMAPKGVIIPDAKTARLMADTHGAIDLNSCSKDDIVYKLGLPIVYANDIDELRKEGFMFTDLDELEDLLNIPPHHLTRIAPLITFHYDLRKEGEQSWRKLNTLSVEELMTYNLTAKDAEIIVAERMKHGQYQSLLEVKKRTGIPLEVYRHLI